MITYFNFLMNKILKYIKRRLLLISTFMNNHILLLNKYYLTLFNAEIIKYYSMLNLSNYFLLALPIHSACIIFMPTILSCFIDKYIRLSAQ